MKISVIIPCRNEKGHIRKFMESALAQELDPGWEMEIVVADGMSDDGTREDLRAYAGQGATDACSVPQTDIPPGPHPTSAVVRVIDNPGRIVSTGLNAAVAASTGEVVVRMDAHTTYAPDYIRQCVSVLRETSADNVGGPWIAQGCGFVGKAIAAAFHSPFCVGGGKAHDPDYEGEVDTVYLGCWLRSVFDRAGFFDPALVRNQDDEFNFRLRRMGGRVWQSPRIKSSYVPRSSLRGLFRQYLQYGFWKVAVIRKHRALASWRHAVPVLFVTWIHLSLALMTLGAALRMPGLAAAVGAVLAIGLTAYFAACTAAALPFARSLHPFSLLILPVVIAMYHVGYGFGFLFGILSWAANVGRAAAPNRVFTTLTR